MHKKRAMMQRVKEKIRTNIIHQANAVQRSGDPAKIGE